MSTPFLIIVFLHLVALTPTFLSVTAALLIGFLIALSFCVGEFHGKE
jgi:hypothetical protein